MTPPSSHPSTLQAPPSSPCRYFHTFAINQISPELLRLASAAICKNGGVTTMEIFHDCGIFTMLRMETFNGGHASSFECGILAESQLQRDMLRRLRFKFVTKILLHEINVLAEKMLELAKEFDKIDHVEKMAIIIDAFKNREE
nr:ulp1 protease family, C-terminal catalytic domain-containing protein [Tanacetum cinerariifolium]